MLSHMINHMITKNFLFVMIPIIPSFFSQQLMKWMGQFYSTWLVRLIRKYVTREDGRGLTKTVAKGDIVDGACGAAKKLMWLTQNLFVSILPATHFFFIFSSSISKVALTILQWTTIKAHPRGYNSVTASL